MEVRSRQYRKEEEASTLPRQPTPTHPLAGVSQQQVIEAPDKEDSSPIFQDPLSVPSALLDPLDSNLPSTSAHAESRKGRKERGRSTTLGPDALERAAAEDWDHQKVALMQRFAGTGTITVSSSWDILQPERRGSSGRGSATAARLEELDSSVPLTSERPSISQEDYVLRLRQLNDEIAHAWLKNERVLALRLAIKVSKLLNDTGVGAFYPTLWVLVTDVLDTVGVLVWTRIKRKAEEENEGQLLPERFTSADVKQEAKDTCRNWFHKIGSIHELLPRIMLEAALLRCYAFLEDGPPLKVLDRLAAMVRGVADPMGAAYAHLYLLRRSLAVVPEYTGHLKIALSHLSLLLSQSLHGKDQKLLVKLLEPPLEMILEKLLGTATEELMDQALKDTSALVLRAFLRQAPGAWLASHALELVALIKKTTDKSISQSELLRLLGEQLCRQPLAASLGRVVLNEVWKVIGQLNLEDYLRVADIFLEFTLLHLQESDVALLLRDVIRRSARQAEGAGEFQQLESFLCRLLDHIPSSTHLLQIAPFTALLDLFQGEYRVSACTEVLTWLGKTRPKLASSEIVYRVFELARPVHDSLDSLSSEDARRQATALLQRYIRQVDFHQDFEVQLAFLVDCRGAFCNLNSLQAYVVLGSLRCATSALSRHSNPEDFVRAALAVAEITIPSIVDPMTRLQLYLSAAQVALICGLLGRVDSLLRSLLTNMQDLTQEDKGEAKTGEGTTQEVALLAFIANLASFLVVVPGHPEHGPFYLAHALVKVINAFPWCSPGLSKVSALGHLLQLAIALAQDHLPYHVPQVESNDALYSGEAAYAEELALLTSSLVEMMAVALQDAPPSAQRATSALEFCNIILSGFEYGEMVDKLTGNLLKMASTSLPQEHTYLQGTFLSRKSLQRTQC